MLVARYSEGDNKAFDELLARYQSKLFNYIFFIVRSQELADWFAADVYPTLKDKPGIEVLMNNTDLGVG